MIEIRTARTLEVDEVDEAVEEIIAGLDLDTLKANSAGIIYCHVDYNDSGIIEALHQRLGFDIVGMTSTSNATEKGFDTYGLSIAVLSSDDVVFKANMSEPLTTENYQTAIALAYSNVRSQIENEPALTFTYIPSSTVISGAEMVRVFDEVSNGAPFWGSTTTGVKLFDEQCRTICNGELSQNGLAMLLLDGDLQPDFFVKSFPRHNISERQAIVTKCERYRIYEANDVPILDFFNSFDLDISPDNLPGTNPILIYYKESGEPVALGVYAVFEDGSVLVGGEVEEGATISLGNVTIDGVMESAKDCLNMAKNSKNKNGTFLLPCITRYFALSPNMDDEIKLAEKELTPTNVPFILGYSGGEICPVKDINGKYVNRFHNYTFTACTL